MENSYKRRKEIISKKYASIIADLKKETQYKKKL